MQQDANKTARRRSEVGWERMAGEESAGSKWPATEMGAEVTPVPGWMGSRWSKKK
jgi:hypothetical protein